MIRGLQKLSWKKVDVSFHSAIWPFFAHNNIHVLQPLDVPVRDVDFSDAVPDLSISLNSR